MPKQSSARVPGHTDLEWAKNQPWVSSPTEGAGSEDIENLELLHNEAKGLHDPKTKKSVAPDAVSNAARPLSRRDFGGPTTVNRHAEEASHQRDYDGAGTDKKPANLGRVTEDGDVDKTEE